MKPARVSSPRKLRKTSNVHGRTNVEEEEEEEEAEEETEAIVGHPKL